MNLDEALFRAINGLAGQSALIDGIALTLSNAGLLWTPGALHDALGIQTSPASVTDLLAALEEWEGAGAILILDDLHEIAGSAAERSLEQFVDLRPHRLRVLAGSRRPARDEHPPVAGVRSAARALQ